MTGLRGRIKWTRFGWRADVLLGGQPEVTTYHRAWENANWWVRDRLRLMALTGYGENPYNEIP